MLETEAGRSPHTTMESLKVSLVKDWAKIPKKMRAAVESFRGRIERVNAAEGGHIKNRLCYCFVRLRNIIRSM